MINQRTIVEGLGEVRTSTGNLQDNVRDLKGKLISARDEAYARIKTSGTAQIGRAQGTRFAIEFDYLSGEAPVALKYAKLSPTMAKRAVEANSHNQYLCTDSARRYDANRKIADREDKSGVPYADRTAIALPREQFNMSPDENPNHFAFFLEDLAGKEGENSYFAFIGKQPIAFYPIDKNIVDGKNNPELLQNPKGTIVVPYGWFPYGWFRSLGGRSVLSGSNRGADYCDIRARRVRKASAEGAKPAQKISRADEPCYSPKEARTILKDARYLLSGRARVDELLTDSPRARRVLSFLEKLGQ